MMDNIFKFELKESPTKIQALRWLYNNKVKFPKIVENDIGPNLFNGWRFINGLGDIIYFADCLHEGITESDYIYFINVHKDLYDR